MAEEQSSPSTLIINGEEFSVTNASVELSNDIDGALDAELKGARISGPIEFEGSITTRHEPGDNLPMPCPECGHVPTEAGSTVDEIPSVECPECDWFDVLDDPLDEIYGGQQES